MRDNPALLGQLKEFDAGFIAAHGSVAGLDEAGRGPLFGPVVAACVMVPPDWGVSGIYDSKKLTPKRREVFAALIRENALCYGIGQADAREIDDLNILRATRLAMARAAAAMGRIPGVYLVDYIKDLGLQSSTEAIVKGDQKSYAIACASILAKTHRDALLAECAKRYPDYGLESHKGYPTKAHYAALRRFGPTPEHRQSFLRNV